MEHAVNNQAKIQTIRRLMLSGKLNYEQAKAEAQPVIDDINTTAKRLAAKHKLHARTIHFEELMR